MMSANTTFKEWNFPTNTVVIFSVAYLISIAKQNIIEIEIHKMQVLNTFGATKKIILQKMNLLKWNLFIEVLVPLLMI